MSCGLFLYYGRARASASLYERVPHARAYREWGVGYTASHGGDATDGIEFFTGLVFVRCQSKKVYIRYVILVQLTFVFDKENAKNSPYGLFSRSLTLLFW